MTKIIYLKDEDGNVLINEHTGLPYDANEFFVSKKGNVLRKKGYKNGKEYTFEYDEHDRLIQQSSILIQADVPNKNNTQYSSDALSPLPGDPVQPIVRNDGPPPVMELGSHDPRSFARGKPMRAGQMVFEKFEEERRLKKLAFAEMITKYNDNGYTFINSNPDLGHALFYHHANNSLQDDVVFVNLELTASGIKDERSNVSRRQLMRIAKELKDVKSLFKED